MYRQLLSYTHDLHKTIHVSVSHYTLYFRCCTQQLQANWRIEKRKILLRTLLQGDGKLVTSIKVVPSKSVLRVSHKPKFIHFFLVIDVTICQIFWHSEGNTGTTTFIFICFIKLKRQRTKLLFISINISQHVNRWTARSCLLVEIHFTESSGNTTI